MTFWGEAIDDEEVAVRGTGGGLVLPVEETAVEGGRAGALVGPDGRPAQWSALHGPPAPEALKAGRTPFDKLAHAALLYQALRMYCALSQLSLRWPSGDAVRQPVKSQRVLNRMERALASAEGPYPRDAVRRAFFQYVEPLLFDDLVSDTREVRVCSACGHLARTAAGREGGRCMRYVARPSGAGWQLCGGARRGVTWQDLCRKDRAACRICAKTATRAPIASAAAASVGPVGPGPLRLGQTPFDALDRPALLFQCVRLFSALAQVHKHLSRYAYAWGRSGPGRYALARAEVALSSACGGYRDTERFFELTARVLFEDVVDQQYHPPRICARCGPDRKVGASHESGEYCRPGPFGQRCSGPFRPVGWADLSVPFGVAEVVFGVFAPHRAGVRLARSGPDGAAATVPQALSSGDRAQSLALGAADGAGPPLARSPVSLATMSAEALRALDNQVLRELQRRRSQVVAAAREDVERIARSVGLDLASMAREGREDAGRKTIRRIGANSARRPARAPPEQLQLWPDGSASAVG